MQSPKGHGHRTTTSHQTASCPLISDVVLFYRLCNFSEICYSNTDKKKLTILYNEYVNGKKSIKALIYF